MASPKTPEHWHRKILRENSLRAITVTITAEAYHAHALPDSFHPAVAKRRAEALERAADADGSISMAAASKASEGAMEEVASASGQSLEGALTNLVSALKGTTR